MKMLLLPLWAPGLHSHRGDMPQLSHLGDEEVKRLRGHEHVIIFKRHVKVFQDGKDLRGHFGQLLLQMRKLRPSEAKSFGQGHSLFNNAGTRNKFS